MRTPESPLPSHSTALTGPAACCGLRHHQLGNTAPVKAGLGPRPALVSPGLPALTPTLLHLLSAACSGHRAQGSARGTAPTAPTRQVRQSQVTGCGAAGTRTGHAQVPGRKHAMPSTSPSPEESGWGQTEWPQAAIFTLQWSQPPEKKFHPTGKKSSVSLSVSLHVTAYRRRL